MAVRLSLLVGLGVALGCTTPPPAPAPSAEEAGAPSGSVAADKSEVSPPRATATTVSRDVEPCAPREAPPKPVAEAKAAAPPELPPYEVTRRTTSPDGATWCILDLDLRGGAASLEAMRALWAELKSKEPAEWTRFTCRFHLGRAVWDVNEITILESSNSLRERLRRLVEPEPGPPWRSLEEACRDGQIGWMEVNCDGKFRCLVTFGGDIFEVPVSVGKISVRGTGAVIELKYVDPDDGQTVIICPFAGTPRPSVCRYLR